MTATTTDKPAAPDAATRKALDRADHHGCAACGQPFDYGQPTALARVPGRVLSAYHVACVPPRGRITGLSAMMTGEDPHTAADREWFASNPGRRAYLRPPAGLSELQLLANRAALSVLRAGVPEATIEHVRQQMQQTIAAYHRDPSSVAMLVAQVEPGVRVRHPMQLQPGEAIDTIAPHAVEQAALGLLDGQDAQALSQRYPDVSHVEAQLLPAAMLAAAANKQTCPLDIAAAEGQARHATKH